MGKKEMLGNELRNEQGNELENELRNELRNEPGNEPGNELENELGNELGNEPGNELGNELENELRNELGNELESKAGNVSGAGKKKRSSVKKRIMDVLWWLLLFFAIGVMFWTGRQVYDYLNEADTSKKVNQNLIEQAVSTRPAQIGHEALEEGGKMNMPRNDEETALSENGEWNNETTALSDSANSGAETSKASVIGLSESYSKADSTVISSFVDGNSWLSVDFNVLKRTNGDIIAWLYCPGTPVNYPVVQATDNDYYLRRLTNGETNTAGTLFLDCRNWGDFSDQNSVIHGHHMKNDTMFGTLSDYSSQSFYEKHPVWQLLTPDGDYMVELIAGYVTNETSEIYTFGISQEEKLALIDESMRLSDFVTAADWDETDRLVTFSTCSYEYNEARYVVVGVMKELPES